MIHEFSGRADGKFVHLNGRLLKRDVMETALFGSEELTIDRVAIQPGALEESSNGTLLIDHVANLPTMLQMKLARAMEYHHFYRVDGFEQVQVNVRMIAASDSKPLGMTAEENFKNEIYYRMCPVIINLPPLRERREDILFLIEKFAAEFSLRNHYSPKGLTAGALRSCLAYDWPGNAKEVQLVINHAAASCSDGFIRKNDLPEYLQRHTVARQKTQETEIVND
jgi:two-component system NtrC family response regulator